MSGQINYFLGKSIEEFCDRIIAVNPEAAKFIDKNHSAGISIGFNILPKKKFVNKHLNPKTLPS